MKRFYLLRWEQWNYEHNCFYSYGAEYENKAAAMREFEQTKLSAGLPKVQVWEQLRKNDGFVQAQRRLAIKEF